MKEEQQIPPNIVAFKDSFGNLHKYDNQYKSRGYSYEKYVEACLIDSLTPPFTIHTISVDGKEWSVGDKTNHLDTILSFIYRFDKYWAAKLSNGYIATVEYLNKLPPPSQQDRSVSQPGKEKRIAIIGAGPKAKALLLAQRMFNKLHEPDAQFADPPQPSQLGESYNVRKEIDWHNANVKMVCELEEELATLRAESQAKDTRIKELEKENKKLLRYWVLHNPEMPPGFGHPENGD